MHKPTCHSFTCVQVRLIKYVAAESLHISYDEVEERLATLLLLVPDLRSQVNSMKPKVLAALLNDVTAVANRLVELTEVFPRADIAAMVGRQPPLMLSQPPALRESADRLMLLLQLEDVDRQVRVRGWFASAVLGAAAAAALG